MSLITRLFFFFFLRFGHQNLVSSLQVVAKTLDDMLAMNASVNMYMFHGGTSFGLKAGKSRCLVVHFLLVDS